MLDGNPVVKERLMAVGAFAGIALFAVAAVDVMLTGGFDFAPTGAVSERQQSSAYVRVVDAAQYVSDQVRTISWDEQMFVGEANAATTEDLAGANDGSSEAISQPSSDDLYSEISALYEQSDREEAYVEEPPYQDAPSYDEPSYDEEFSPEEAEKLASAYGNG